MSAYKIHFKRNLPLLCLALSFFVYLIAHHTLLFHLCRDWIRHPILMAPHFTRGAVMSKGFPDYAFCGVWMLFSAAFLAFRVARWQIEDGTGLRLVCAALAFCCSLIFPFHLIGYLKLGGLPVLLNPYTLFAASLPLTLLSLIFRKGRQRERPIFPRPHLPPVAGAALAVILVGWLGCLGNSWLLGPSHFDSLWYQLPMMVQWFQTGTMAPPPWWPLTHLTSDILTSWYPGNANCVGFVLLSLPYGARLVCFMQMPFLILAALSVYGCARLVQHKPVDAVWSVITLLSLPIVIDQCSQPLVDVATGAFVSVALYALLRILTDAPSRTVSLILLALSSGLAIGTKLSGIAPVLVILLAAVLELLRRRTLVWRDFAIVLPLIWVGGGFWYLRNFELLGTWFPYGAALDRISVIPKRYVHAGDLFAQLWGENYWTPWEGLGPLFLAVVPTGLLVALSGIRRGSAMPKSLVALFPIAASLLAWWTMTSRHLYLIIYFFVAFCSLAPYFKGQKSVSASRPTTLLLFAAVVISQLFNLDCTIRIGNLEESFPWFQPSPNLIQCVDRLPAGRILALTDSRYPDGGDRQVESAAFYLCGSAFHLEIARPDQLQTQNLGEAQQEGNSSKIATLINQMGVRYIYLRIPDPRGLDFYRDANLKLVYSQTFPTFLETVFATDSTGADEKSRRD